MTSEPNPPDVSVVVIVYNDATRLETAVRSVLDQSLRRCEVVIVNDASTDRSAEVADRLAARDPDRVRAVHLEQNSGGCGRPRNVGIGHVRGRYVMFLDSDDTLDPQAARNMFRAAERSDADLVVGQTVRVNVDTGKEVPWFPHLFRHSAVHSSVLDQPDLLYDTLSTNKLYRRSFLDRAGLNFVEDLHYEDLIFSARAYLSARTIALIPHRVYNWLVTNQTNAPSITNRRGEIKNFADRITVNRLIDEALDEHGAHDLRLPKDTKFINHDLPLYLYQLRHRDAQYQAAFLDLAAPYVAQLDPRAFERASRVKAIAAYLVSRRDLPTALTAVDLMDRFSHVKHLSTELVHRDGRVFWTDRHLDDPLGRRVLDVTTLGLHDRPLNKIPLASVVRRFERAGARATVEADILLPLGRGATVGKLAGFLDFTDRQRPHRRFRVPLQVRAEGDRLFWTAQFEPGRLLRPVGIIDAVWDLRARITVGGATIATWLVGDEANLAVATLPVRPRLSRLIGDRLEPYWTANGRLSFRITEHNRAARGVGSLMRSLRSTSGVGGLWDRVRQAERALLARARAENTKISLYHSLFLRLPARPGLVVFESDLGRHYTGNPRYVYEELRRCGAAVEAVWAYQDSRDGFPDDATLVQRGSWAYYRALARASFWVDDHGFPGQLRKRRDTSYLQTWHGSPVERVGFDEPALNAADRARQQDYQRATDRFDFLVVRSEHDVRTLLPALRSGAEVLRTGYPRNDALVTGGDPTAVAALRKRLRLDDGRRVVLYVPTPPPAGAGEPAPTLDLERFAEQLGDGHVLLVRPDPSSRLPVPPGLDHAVRNVADVHDVTLLLLVADVLVTDFSPLMFDYALLDRPMLFFAPDFDERVRGTYPDLAGRWPGPVLRDDDAVIAALRELPVPAGTTDGTHRDFVDRFAEYDTGTAAKAIVDRLFAAGGRRG